MHNRREAAHDGNTFDKVLPPAQQVYSSSWAAQSSEIVTPVRSSLRASLWARLHDTCDFSSGRIVLISLSGVRSSVRKCPRYLSSNGLVRCSPLIVCRSISFAVFVTANCRFVVFV